MGKGLGGGEGEQRPALVMPLTCEWRGSVLGERPPPRAASGLFFLWAKRSSLLQSRLERSYVFPPGEMLVLQEVPGQGTGGDPHILSLWTPGEAHSHAHNGSFSASPPHVGRPPSLQVILYTSTSVIFLKCNSDHVTFTLKILQQVPKFFRIEILTTLHGIQALSCFGFLTTSHSLSPYSAQNISSPSCETMCDFPTPQLSLVSGSLSMLFPLPGMSFPPSRPLAPLSISSSPFKSQFQSQLLSDKVARLPTQTKCLPSCPIGPPMSPPKKSHGQSETLGFLSVFPTVCPYR